MPKRNPKLSPDMVSLLLRRAESHPDAPLYTYLRSGEEEGERLTFAGLDARARTLASALRSRVAARERVLLLFQPGLEFPAAFFACLYADVVAVPLPSPRLSNVAHYLGQVVAIAKTAEPRAVLTTTELRTRVAPHLAGFPPLASLAWFDADGPQAGEASWLPEKRPADLTAFLQYTSGSTSLPKGVDLTHGNLLHNLKCFDDGCVHGEGSSLVTWLPPFHDLGLVYGLLLPVFAGIPAYVIPNAAFIQKPVRWLQAVTRYRATHSMGPNFAYDHCVRNVRDAELEGLDLSSWEMAMNAAEPVRANTMEAFVRRFGPRGFRRETFNICYGLAESTCIVTSSHAPASRGGKRLPPREIHVDGAALQDNRVVLSDASAADAQSLVGCGPAIDATELAVVDPETLRPAGPGRVGEIWAASPSVAKGYSENPGVTAEAFGHSLEGGAGRYLRTGDLGFLHEGEVYITGRLKDLLIIRGRNHYPQDLEWTVGHCHPLLKPFAAAAFAVEADGEERVVVIQEVARRFDPVEAPALIRTLCERVAADHDLQLQAVALIREGSIPKTTSGKIQRRRCRSEFQAGSLQLVHQWVRGGNPAASGGAVSAVPDASAAAGPGAPEILAWIEERIAARCGLRPNEVAPDAAFAALGVDSHIAVSLTGELSDWLGRALSPTLLYNHPSPGALAAHLASGKAVPAAAKGEAYPDGAVAIVGMACRFPGAASLEAFWSLLAEGRDAIVPPPAARVALIADALGLPPGEVAAGLGHGGYVEDVEAFDPAFFSISPREAERMDPQQRLLLMTAWHALENAGVPARSLAGTRTGVFVGIGISDYALLNLGDAARADVHGGTGSSASIAANRLSYAFDLKGPSLAVDTACSSSLVSVHLAGESLRRGECDAALAGGVNVLVNPVLTETLRRAGMLSPNGRCRAFDDAADGYVRGEGCGVVVLKRLADALRDGNRVLAVLAATSVNQDGRTNGITAPNGLAQREALRLALSRAGIEPGRVSCVEAHGTGTSLGDPIEFEALSEVLGPPGPRAPSCLVGSVKANIGHLEAASGIAGLIKLVLCLGADSIPPQANYLRPNRHFSLGGSRLAVSTRALPWRTGDGPRVACLSSMGFGGTNAVAVLMDPPAPSAGSGPVAAWRVLPLSAKSPAALAALAEAYGRALERRPEDWPGLCAAAARRDRFPHRAAVAAADPVSARALLSGPLPAFRNAAPRAEGRPGIAFCFTGQDSRYPDMGHGLYGSHPGFRDRIDACDDEVRRMFGLSLRELLWGESGSTVADTRADQVAIFALEYCLASWLMDAGLVPDFVVGHSLGEIVAACVAGVHTFAEGLALVEARGRLMQACPERTGMTAAAAGIAVRRLEATRGFHSEAMDPLLADFEREAARLTARPPRISLVSARGGRIFSGAAPDSAYWRDHPRGTVEFAAAMEALGRADVGILLEVGPHPALAPLILECLPQAEVLPLLRRGEEDGAALAGALACLHEAGFDPDFTVLSPAAGPRADAPVYPFELRTCWIRPATSPAAADTEETMPMDIMPELKDTLGGILKLDPASLDSGANLLSLGADSLVLVELTGRLKCRFGVDIPVSRLFDDLSTLEALAAVVAPLAVADRRQPTADDPGTMPVNPANPAAGAAVAREPVAAVIGGPKEGAAGSAEPAPAIAALLAQQLEAFSRLIAGQNALLAGLPPSGASSTTTPERPEVANIVRSGHNTHAPEPSRPEPARSIPTREGSGLTPARKEHIRALAERYSARTAASKAYSRAHRAVFADYRNSLGFRQVLKEMQYPIVAREARGSRITDLDGNVLVDLTMGFGSALLGHNPPEVIEAISRQLARGIQVGPKCDMSGEAAALVSSLTGMERVAFANSGTEAVMTALRLARTATGRQKYVRFAGSYHGHSDATLVKPDRLKGELDSLPQAPGVSANAARDAVVLEYGNPKSLAIIRELAPELAAVLVEPVQSRRPDLQPAAFLRELRDITSASGTALVFDEIITGFRVHPGGAQAHLGVRADLATYGKVAGGGMPIGIVAGRPWVMDAIDGGAWRFGDDSGPRAEATFFAGTFSAHPLAMAALLSALGRLREAGPALQEDLNRRTTAMAERLNAWYTEHLFPIRVAQYGSLFRFVVNGNYGVEFQPLEANLLFFHMIERGVYVWEGHTCFLSTAHTGEDVETIESAARGAALAMREGGFFPLPEGAGHGPSARSAAGVSPVSVDPRLMASALVAGAAADGRDESLRRYDRALADLDLLCVSYAAEALAALGFRPADGSPAAEGTARIESSRRNRRLLRRLLAMLEEDGRIRRTDRGWVPGPAGLPPASGEVADRTAAAHPELVRELTLLRRCGPALADVLTGRANPVELLFPGGSADDLEALYAEAPGPRLLNDMLRRALGAAAGSASAGAPLRVLEIGAGTGGSTASLLGALDGLPAEYVVTDVSPALVALCRRRFGGWSGADFSVLDIGRSPADQGFTEAGFDIVVAANVLHATPDLEAAVRHAASLLAPGGMLLLLEGTRPQRWVDLIFGLTDGWWSFEDESLRPAYPLIDGGAWERLLERTGFGSVAEASVPGWQAVILARRAGADEPAVLPLSRGQSEILVHCQLGGDIPIAYNEMAVFSLEGSLDTGRLRDAVSAAADRHASLRSRVLPDGESRAVLPAGGGFAAAFVQRETIGENPSERAAAAILEEASRPIDVEKGPVLRAVLVRTDAAKHLLVLVSHHVFIDGWSFGVLMDEVAAAYSAFVAGRSWTPAPAPDFAGYVAAEERRRASPEWEADAAFWKARLAGGLPALDLPLSRPRPALQTYRAARVHGLLDREVARDVRAAAAARGATPFMLLLGAWQLALHAVSGQDEVMVGVPAALRDEPEWRRLVGYCVNILPVRSRLHPADTLDGFLASLRGEVLEIFGHRHHSFPDMMRAAQARRDPSRPPVFQVLFNFEKEDMPAMEGLAVSAYIPPIAMTKYEATLNVLERGEDLVLSLDYNADLLDREYALVLLARVRLAIARLARGGSDAVGSLCLALPEEESALAAWNRVPLVGPFRTLQEMFLAQAERTPDAAALRHGDEEWSFRHLVEASAALAAALRARGVGPGARVGICLERKPSLVVAMLGVLRSGAAYVPMDTRYPAERLAFMAADADLSLILAGETSPAGLGNLPVPVLDPAALPAAPDAPDKDPEIDPEALAYFIYTSGSTGMPKGVAITHRSASAMLLWAADLFPPAERAGILASTSVCFDLSIFEIFLPLTAGGKAILVENALALAGDGRKDDITLVNTVPSAMEEVLRLDALPASVLTVNLAGEALDPALANRIFAKAPGTKVYNLYGPSEDTTYSTWLRVDEPMERPMTVGRPVSNTRAYVLDDRLNPVPRGTKGILYLAGDGLAQGYWGRPALTAGRFLPDPFSGDGGRMYDTGDVARFLRDGEIEFLGRRDHQVKIRGFRIELGEIEAAMKAHPDVEAAAVLAAGPAGSLSLAGFASPRGGADAEALAANLRGFLRERLPEHMVPGSLEVLPALPLNPNGKIDRKDLAVRGRSGLATPFVAPRSELERDLAALWQEHLGAARVGIRDNFFDFGGHSLMAIRILHRLNAKYGLKLNLADVLTAQTVEDLGERILTSLAEQAAAIAGADDIAALIEDIERNA